MYIAQNILKNSSKALKCKTILVHSRLVTNQCSPRSNGFIAPSDQGLHQSIQENEIVWNDQSRGEWTKPQ